MRQKRILPAAWTTMFVLAGVALSGCGAALYEEGSWIPPDSDAVIADWDVASAQCEGEAINKRANAAEKARARAGFQSAMQAGQELGNTGSDEAFAIGLAVGLMGGLLSEVAASNMDEEAKDAHFIRCMRRLGWNANIDGVADDSWARAGHPHLEQATYCTGGGGVVALCHAH